MPVEITKAQIAELRGLLAKATPGPWSRQTLEPTTLGHEWIDAPTGRYIAVCRELLKRNEGGPAILRPELEEIAANTALIVLMRNVLPALLDLASKTLASAREGEDSPAGILDVQRMLTIHQPKGGDANANGSRDASKPIPATSPGVTAGASVGEDAELCKRLEIKADMIQLGEGIAWGSDSEIMREAAARIRSLSAQLAEARREMDAYRDAFGCLSCGECHPPESMCPPHEVRSSGMGSHRQQIGKAVARATAAESEAAALRKRVGVLEKALEPFAKTAEYYEPIEGDDADHLWGENNLKIGDLRRARTALEGRE